MENALKYANNSSPGPDGIPYSAYRGLPWVVDILLDASRDLCAGGAPPWDFNFAYLWLLPNKPTGALADGRKYYAGEHTRPLSIVNTDNRLLASAVRLVVEEPFGRWISMPQRGFARGRSML